MMKRILFLLLFLLSCAGYGSAQESICGQNAAPGHLDGGNQYYIIAIPCVTGSNTLGYTVATLSVYIVGTSGSLGIDIGIYTDASGSPGSLVCHTGVQTFTPLTGWNSFGVSGCGTLSANTQYWISFVTDNDPLETGEVTGICPGTGSQYTEWSANNVSGNIPLPSSAPSFTTGSNYCSDFFAVLNAKSSPVVTSWNGKVLGPSGTLSKWNGMTLGRFTSNVTKLNNLLVPPLSPLFVFDIAQPTYCYQVAACTTGLIPFVAGDGLWVVAHASGGSPTATFSDSCGGNTYMAEVGASFGGGVRMASADTLLSETGNCTVTVTWSGATPNVTDMYAAVVSNENVMDLPSTTGEVGYNQQVQPGNGANIVYATLSPAKANSLILGYCLDSEAASELFSAGTSPLAMTAGAMGDANDTISSYFGEYGFDTGTGSVSPTCGPTVRGALDIFYTAMVAWRPPSPGPAWVTSGSNATGNNTSPATISVGSVQAGDWVNYLVTAQNGSATITMSDNCNTGGSSDTPITDKAASGNSGWLIGHFVVGANTAPCTVTYAWSPGLIAQIVTWVVRGVTGIETVPALNDQTGSGGISAGANVIQSNQQTTTVHSNDLCVGASSDTNTDGLSTSPGTQTVVWRAGANYTVSGEYGAILSEFYKLSGTGSPTAEFTLNTGVAYPISGIVCYY